MKLTIRDFGHKNEEYTIYPIEILPMINHDCVISLSVFFDTIDEYTKAVSGAIPASIIEKEYEELLAINLNISSWYKVLIS